MSKPNAKDFAEIAYSYRDSGIPYSKWDCQAFVEVMLQKVGVKRNWRGSNHMWREALSWKGTVEECIQKFGCIPPGAWLFTLKWDGSEKKRGYYDDQGAAVHVGIYTGLGKGVMHSTAGGVQEGPFPDARWNRVGLAIDLEYDEKVQEAPEPPASMTREEILADAMEAIKAIVEDALNGNIS